GARERRRRGRLAHPAKGAPAARPGEDGGNTRGDLGRLVVAALPEPPAPERHGHDHVDVPDLGAERARRLGAEIERERPLPAVLERDHEVVERTVEPTERARPIEGAAVEAL